MKIFIKNRDVDLKTKIEIHVFVPFFLILTLIAFVNLLQVYNQIPAKTLSASYLARIAISKMVYFWYFIIVAFVIQQLSRRIPLSRQALVRWSLVHLTALVISFFIHASITLGIEKLLGGIEQKSTLVFIYFNNPLVWLEILVYALFVLGFNLLEYRKINEENKIKFSHLEMQLIKSKLRELRSKIQPTFLFNTLQTILEFVRARRNKEANHILSLLSDFLRTTVYDNEREEITLEEELCFLNKYLEIEKIRYQHVLSVVEEIDTAVSTAVVPNFILQPIVEELLYRNAAQNHHKHRIIIRAKKLNSNLDLKIEDQCKWTNEERLDEEECGVVLNITRDRLSHLYGDHQSLKVKLERNGIVIVNIRIPYKETEVESELNLAVESEQ